MKRILPLLLLAPAFLCAQAKGPAYAPSLEKESLGRGLAVINNTDSALSVSWRITENDPIDIAFDVYRREGKGKEIKLNKEPLTKTTFFQDKGADAKKVNTYTVKKINSKEVERGASYVLTPQLAKLPYLSIAMQQIPGDSSWSYAPGDATVGDLDGDGEYEIVLMRTNGGIDNASRGMSRGTVFIEAYKLNGKMLWRVDLGRNIRQGGHYTQLMMHDFNGDGKAELAVKTAEGTIFGDGTKIGDTNGDGKTLYVNEDAESRTYGMILDGPEFFSVIEGATGKELARENFIPRGEPGEFGDTWGNRVDRYLGGVGYFDGKTPSILITRGYYAKTVLEAWSFRDGKLKLQWRFDTTADNGKYRDYQGQGNHNLSIGDLDGDGKDEIVFGACAIDHDGTPLYNTRLGHGDAMHLTDIDIDRPGLEVWQCHESAPSRAGSEMRDALTGQLIWGIPAVEDVGRAMCADIDPRFRGCEVWTSSSNGVYTADGRFITERKPSVNMAVWWDGDLNRELLDGSGGGRAGGGRVNISKWNGDGADQIGLPAQADITANNGTKGNPSLHVDIFGDWREEVIVRTKDNKEVRVYMTSYPTDYRFHTLMNDVGYRLSVATQNIAYNQPAQPGFYLGSDLGIFWNTRYQLATTGGKSGVSAAGRPNGLNERYKGATLVSMNDIKTGDDSYDFDARYDYDTIVWEVDGTLVKGTDRKFVVTVDQIGWEKPVTIKVKATYHGCVFEDTATLTFTKKPREVGGRNRN